MLDYEAKFGHTVRHLLEAVTYYASQEHNQSSDGKIWWDSVEYDLYKNGWQIHFTNIELDKAIETVAKRMSN